MGRFSSRTAVLLAGLVLTGCHVADPQDVSGTPRAGSTSQAIPALDWQECGARVECTTMPAPADWNDPDGAQIAVNIARWRATDAASRIGALVLNLGAGSSTGALPDLTLPPSLTRLNERFDLVVMDPRGLGSADNGTLVQCPTPQPTIYALVLDPSDSGWHAHAERNAAYDESCRGAAGALYAGLTSRQVAQDIDLLRAALGEERLRYVGNSYGTTYGQAYLELFGNRVERMYLDGLADHSQPNLREWLAVAAITTEEQLRRFASWCAERQGCALHGSDAVAVWDELAIRAEAEPLPAAGVQGGVTAGQLHAGALIGLSPPRWPHLAQALAEARDGDATAFATVLAPPPPEAHGSVQGSLLCHDYMPTVPDRAAFQSIEDRLREVGPRIGWLVGRLEVGRCLGIRGDPAYPPRPLSVDGLPPLLVGIGETDNNTPHGGAARWARQLPNTHTLWHGDGHAAFLLGNTCLAGHVQRYLEEGEIPPEGTTCPAELLTLIPDRPGR